LSPAELAEFAENQVTALHREKEMHREKALTDKADCNNASTAEVLPMGEDLGGAKNISHGLHRFTQKKSVLISVIRG
jgi:uncharacterized protein YigA (DUF484 family)